MNKENLQTLMYDIERAKNWETVHNLILDYINEDSESDNSVAFDEDWWFEFTNSIEHGEILDETVKKTFFAGL